MACQTCLKLRRKLPPLLRRRFEALDRKLPRGRPDASPTSTVGADSDSGGTVPSPRDVAKPDDGSR